MIVPVLALEKVGGFVVGALILDVGIAAALSLGLAIIIGTTIAAHRVSDTDASWSAPRPA